MLIFHKSHPKNKQDVTIELFKLSISLRLSTTWSSLYIIFYDIANIIIEIYIKFSFYMMCIINK